MEKILLISASTSLEDRLGDGLDSPRYVARVSSWNEAHRLLSLSSPAAVVVDAELIDASAVNELVQLQDVLTKDGKAAYVLAEEIGEQLDQWVEMFSAVREVVQTPTTPEGWKEVCDVLGEHLDAHSTPSKDSAGGASASEDPAEPVEVLVRLPEINSGTLGSLTLSRLLYSLRMRDRTGILELNSEKIHRSFGFQSGRFVKSPSHDSAQALVSAWAWEGGEFDFRASESVSGSPVSTYRVIIQGLRVHRTQRQLMNGLMSRMEAYPVVTNLWEQRRDQIDWEVLGRLLKQCDGRSDLESVLGHFASNINDAFGAVALARDTDLVVFRGEPIGGPVVVQYDHDIGAATSEPSETMTKSERAVEDSEREDLEDELRAFLQAMDAMSNHEIFGVWEGCGRELVKETYYRMVKEHHPDVYGGNVSPQIRRLAQQIFINIRNAYSELLKVEAEQTVEPPDSFEAGQSPRRRRQRHSTLHPGQSGGGADGAGGDSSSSPPPGRKRRNTTPIGLGREPSSTHPDLQQQQQRRQKQDDDSRKRPRRSNSSVSEPDASSSPSDASRPSPGTSNQQRKKRSTSVDGGGDGRRDSSAASNSGNRLGDAASDPKWRKERLQKLERSSSRSRRRTSTSGSSKGSIPSPKESSSKDPKKRAQKQFNEGYKHYKNERHSKALPLFEKAHELDSEHGLYMTFLANCLFQIQPDDIERSIQLLRDAIETENRQALPDAHLFLGNMLKVQGHEERAYKHFKRALKLNPGSRDAEREIRLYERRNKSDDDDSGGFFKKLFKK